MYLKADIAFPFLTLEATSDLPMSLMTGSQRFVVLCAGVIFGLLQFCRLNIFRHNGQYWMVHKYKELLQFRCNFKSS